LNEEISKTADLPEEDPAAFAFLTQYLYTGKTPTLYHSTYNPSSFDAGHRGRRCATYTVLHILATNLLVPQLADRALTVLLTNYRAYSMSPTIPTVLAAYQIAAPESGLCSFMSACLVERAVAVAVALDEEQCSSEEIWEAIVEEDELALAVIR